MKSKQYIVSRFWLFTILSSLVAAFFSILKPIDLLPDMSVYKMNFDIITQGGVVAIEPTYILLSKFASSVGSNFYFVIFIYAIFSVYIKLRVIHQFNKRYYLFFLYICSYLILHEFIQIRVGLAISFLFCSYLFSLKRQFYKMFIFFVLAILFHVSALIFVVLYLLALYIVKSDFLIKALFLSVLFFFIVAVSGGGDLNFLASFLPGGLKEKYYIYVEMQSYLNESFNLLSVKLVLFYIIIVLYLARIDRVSQKDKVLVVTFLLFLMLGFFFVSLPAFAFRTIEIVSPFIIFLIASINDYYKSRWVNIISLVFISSSLYYSCTLFL
ncbi:EpsG family protein [Shewanella baltica]|uniref:EpsG family protein n=1 Tax=Shewanella baltica TaxID=62322 RepID=UPI00217D856E|nr:EpsG family protein [Shewanella baltica]MCS6209212.1 EpsG family protein [Shewanella baltica]